MDRDTRRKKERKALSRTNIVMSQLLNQAEHELIGGVWVDENNKHHLVGLTLTTDGHLVPDYPKMEDAYIKQAYQVGLKF